MAAVSAHSLVYYLLIDQYKPRVELFSRIEESNDLSNRWIYAAYESLDDVIVLPRLNAELSLTAIYDDIEFTGEEEDL